MTRSKRKVLICSDEATPCKKQITKPCSDCPFARAALSGWLGGLSAKEWIQVAHGDPEPTTDHTGLCHAHTGDIQCAGLAIYRANVCKKPRNPKVLILPRDTDLVFASPNQFIEHHQSLPEVEIKKNA